MTPTAESYPKFLMALCIWREARGQSFEAKVAIKHVILNRVNNPKGPYARCKDVVSVIMCPAQFSSMGGRDVNAAKLPKPIDAVDWRAWMDCCEIVDTPTTDRSNGANYYFDPSIAPPTWADPAKLTATIDGIRFYKL